MHEAFFGGPPIVCAVLGLATVEHELDTLLLRAMKRKDDATWNLLTSESGPFSTFSAKVSAGYALGLYDEVTRDHLNRIRKIRNSFAHAQRLLSFDDEVILDLIRKSALPTQRYSERYKDVVWLRSKRRTGQEAFVALCTAAFTVLSRRQRRGLVATGRNYSRRIKQLSRANPLGLALVTNQPQGLAAALQLYLPPQSGHPDRPSQPSGLGGLFDLGAAALDKNGK